MSRNHKKTKEQLNNNKPKKVSINEIVNTFNSAIGILLSIIAIILASNANSFSKDMSPLTYSYEFVNRDPFNISTNPNSNVSYNVSDIVITIENNPGKISDAYIAYVDSDKDGENFIDIRHCEQGSDIGILFKEYFILKYKYIVKSSDTELSIGFNDFREEKYGHFFIVFKSYSGNYYYNMIHYVINDEAEYDESTCLYLVNTKTDFINMTDIYSLDKMAKICDDINNKKYIQKPIELNDYINQLENDYKLLKSKLEG